MYERYGYNTSEYGSAISVDDILAEFEQQNALEAERRRDERLNAYLNAADELFKKPEPERDEEGVRVYKPKSRVALMEQEALELDFDSEEDEEEPQEEPAYEQEEEPEYELDHRFYMGEEREVEHYEGPELDMSADEDYEAPNHVRRKDVAEHRFEKALKEKKQKKDKKKKRSKALPEDEQYLYEYSESFDDMYAASAEYAPERDYDFAEEEQYEEEDPLADFPTFKEYCIGLVVNAILMVSGIFGGKAAKVSAEVNEELGKELPPMAASKYYGSYVHSMRLRVRISLILVALMAIFTLVKPLPGALKMPEVRAAMLMAMQFTILVLGLDTFTGSVVNVFRKRVGIDFVASLACIITGIDAVGVFQKSFGQSHIPLCLVSSMSFVGIMYANLLSVRAMRKAMRVPAIGRQCFAVTGEVGIKGKNKDITILKSLRGSQGFVRRAEEMPYDEEVFNKVCPFLLIFVLLLAMAACSVQGSFECFMQNLSSVIVAACPIAGLMCFALPFFVGSNRIFSSGASIAGWSGVSDIGQSKNLIISDRDIFPESAIEIENIRVFADEKPQRIIAYAGTMITASGSTTAAAFSKLMEKHKCTLCQLDNFEYLSGGGMKAMIEGRTVLCGSTDLMRLMNVKLPFRLVTKTSVLLAIDGVLYGIFNVKYEAKPQIRNALLNLMKSNRHPIFAVRDFNITPEMIKNSFDVATDGYDFPPYVERFKMTETVSDEGNNIAAVVCLEGLAPLAHMADTGRSIYVATRMNVYISLAAAIFGMVLVFAKIAVSGSIGVGFLAAFALLWALPVIVLSTFLKF